MVTTGPTRRCLSSMYSGLHPTCTVTPRSRVQSPTLHIFSTVCSTPLHHGVFLAQTVCLDTAGEVASGLRFSGLMTPQPQKFPLNSRRFFFAQMQTVLSARLTLGMLIQVTARLHNCTGNLQTDFQVLCESSRDIIFNCWRTLSILRWTECSVHLNRV